MENKKNGWAFGLGIFGGAYQVFVGLILLVFCSKIGGIPYGIALILAGLACGTITFFTRRQKWARLTLLLRCRYSSRVRSWLPGRKGRWL